MSAAVSPASYPGMEPPPLERLFRDDPPRVRIAADQLFGGIVGGTRPCAVRGIFSSLIVRVEKRRGATSSISTTAPMARCSTRRTSAGASPSRCCASPRASVRDHPVSASMGRRATTSIIWRGRSCCPPISRRGRLYRDRDARRVRIGDAHCVQWLRIGRDGGRRGRADGLSLYMALEREVASNVVTL